MNKETVKNIDEYISRFPADIQTKLQEIRATIHAAVPDAEETISYQMPAFKLNGILVYFAAFAKHISFFPTASGIAGFQQELSGLKTSKGTIQFPLDKPIPYDLVRDIAVFRARENLHKSTRK
jgi:uncharacterized protein YdhG (YjbR/CyaY superfamily)